MDLKNIKIVAFDVDGTILPYEQESVNPEIEQMFKSLKAKGYVTVVATGRDMITLGTINNVPNIDYFIGANGAFIYDFKTKKIIWESTFNYNDFLILEKFLNENELPFSVMTERSGYHSENFNLDNWFLKDHKENFLPMSKIDTEKDAMHVITIKTKDNKEIEKTFEFLNKANLKMEINSTWSKGFFIAPTGINKAATIDRLAKMINSKFSISQNVICFGDSSNDFEMVQQAAHGVAMANAYNGLKSVAKAIAPEVGKNGTKLYLEKLGVI